MGDALFQLVDVGNGREVARLLFDVAPAESDGAKWIQILPFGPAVVARDGRSFLLSDVNRVIAETRLPLLIDWEHQSERFSGSTEAAGWIEELAADPAGSRFGKPGVWGRVEWTGQGQNDVAGKTYRFVSPAVVVNGETREGLCMTSVALTNRPALDLQGIQAFRETFSAKFGQQEANTMDKTNRTLLLSALALAVTATDEQILEAAKGAVASVELCAQLTKKVAEKDEKIVALETELCSLKTAGEKAAFETKRKEVFDTLSREGKITPAMRPGFEGMCPNAGALELFEKTVVPTLVVIGEKAPASTTAEGGNGGGENKTHTFRNLPKGLNVEELRRSGMTDVQIQNAIDYQNQIKAARRGEEA